MLKQAEVRSCDFCGEADTTVIKMVMHEDGRMFGEQKKFDLCHICYRAHLVPSSPSFFKKFLRRIFNAREVRENR